MNFNKNTLDPNRKSDILLITKENPPNKKAGVKSQKQEQKKELNKILKQTKDY